MVAQVRAGAWEPLPGDLGCSLPTVKQKEMLPRAAGSAPAALSADSPGFCGGTVCRRALPDVSWCIRTEL